MGHRFYWFFPFKKFWTPILKLPIRFSYHFIIPLTIYFSIKNMRVELVHIISMKNLSFKISHINSNSFLSIYDFCIIWKVIYEKWSSKYRFWLKCSRCWIVSKTESDNFTKVYSRKVYLITLASPFVPNC